MEGKASMLCQKLAAFEFTRCGMHHERIRRETGSNVPVKDSLSSHGYSRPDYCASNQRKKQLGCAHTTARIEFQSIACQAGELIGDDEVAGSWVERAKELDMAVIRVDWRKSDAEVEHARLCDALHQGKGDEQTLRSKLANVESHIEELIAIHSGYVSQLEELRDEVLEAIIAL